VSCFSIKGNPDARKTSKERPRERRDKERGRKGGRNAAEKQWMGNSPRGRMILYMVDKINMMTRRAALLSTQ
jgi:hypothetical protein